MTDIVIASGEIVNELPFPAEVYGIVFLVGFAFLGFLVYSYRNVANRHRHKTQGTGNASAHH
jgi:hypothetical protein